MHPSLQSILRWFNADHLPAGPIKEAAVMCSALAYYEAKVQPTSPELVAGLRKLLEAKDCFVRCAVAAEKDAEETDK